MKPFANTPRLKEKVPSKRLPSLVRAISKKGDEKSYRTAASAGMELGVTAFGCADAGADKDGFIAGENPRGGKIGRSAAGLPPLFHSVGLEQEVRFESAGAAVEIWIPYFQAIGLGGDGRAGPAVGHGVGALTGRRVDRVGG